VSKHIPVIPAALLLGFVAFAGGCSKRPDSIVVTTTMLQEAARDVLGGLKEPEVVLLLPPGSCPGQFDLSPRSLPALRSARAVIRHDYQGVLEQKMEQIGAKGIAVVSIPTPASLLVPGNYAALARRVAEILCEKFPGQRDKIQGSLAKIQERAQALGLKVRERAARWKGVPVIASFNQKEFCEYLGLDVVGVIQRPEEVSPREFEELLGQKAAAVIANLQEGVQAAESLAKRKGVPVVVLSNFPDTEGYGTGYEGLMEANLKRLEQVLGKTQPDEATNEK